jgi:hypothetical protein
MMIFREWGDERRCRIKKSNYFEKATELFYLYTFNVVGFLLLTFFRQLSHCEIEKKIYLCRTAWTFQTFFFHNIKLSFSFCRWFSRFELEIIRPSNELNLILSVIRVDANWDAQRALLFALLESYPRNHFSWFIHMILKPYLGSNCEFRPKVYINLRLYLRTLLQIIKCYPQ